MLIIERELITRSFFVRKTIIDVFFKFQTKKRCDDAK